MQKSDREDHVHIEKKMKRSDVGCNPCDVGEELIVNEILCRLRVKPLMRFKCVCKRWQFLIEQDKYFIHQHLARSKPCLLMTGRARIGPECIAKQFFLTAYLLVEGRDRAISAVAVDAVVRDEQEAYETRDTDVRKFIVAFDFDTEKFRSIIIPSYIFNQRPKSTGYIDLKEVNGRLALIFRMSYSSLKLAFLHDHYNKENRTTSNHNWTEVNVELPSYLSDRSTWQLQFLPVFGPDEIIVYKCMWNGVHDDVSVHCFNWKNKSFKIEINRILSNFFKHSRVSTVRLYVESLLPVKQLISKP